MGNNIGGHKCNRCFEVVSEDEISYVTIITSENDGMCARQLCPKCLDELYAFLNNPPSSTGKEDENNGTAKNQETV